MSMCNHRAYVVVTIPLLILLRSNPRVDVRGNLDGEVIDVRVNDVSVIVATRAVSKFGTARCGDVQRRNGLGRRVIIYEFMQW